jgi:hypothetical protein
MDNNKELDRCKELLKNYKLLVLTNKYNDYGKIYNLSDWEYNFKKIYIKNQKKIIEFKEVM